MLFTTYQSIETVEKIGENRIEPYSVWAVPVTNLHDLFLALFCCAPNRMETLIFFESDRFLRIDKIKWYQAIMDGEPWNAHNPKDYISEDTDDLHSEFLVETINPEQIKMLVPIIEIGEAPDILEYRGAKMDQNIENYLMELAMAIIAKMHIPVEENMAFGMEREYAEYRGLMQPKKAAFEMVYLPIAFYLLTATGGSVTLNVRYLANMISYNAEKLLRLNNKFTMWSYDNCSIEGFNIVVAEMEHCIIDNEEIVERLIVGPKIERNELCPCGSGKKYKKCHGFWIN